MERIHYGLRLLDARLDMMSEKRLREMITECERMIDDYNRGRQPNGCSVCHGSYKCNWDFASSRRDEHCVWAMMDRGKIKDKTTCIPFRTTDDEGMNNLRIKQLNTWIEQLQQAVDRRKE